MKRYILAAALIAAILATGAVVYAGAGNIRWTAHNLSSEAPAGLNSVRHQASVTVDQICIFCHTPHHAQPAQPLWNKVNPTQTFKMYTSSTTLTTVAKAVTAPGPESLLCLSCHDGRTAINVLHNSRVGDDYGAGDKIVDIGGETFDGGHPNGDVISLAYYGGFNPNAYGENLGKTASDPYAGNNLMDDHPISFSYSAAYSEKQSAGSDALRTIENAKSQGMRFFGANRDRMECSTCHDPHVDYGYVNNFPTGSPSANTALKPFLVRSNSGSAMCLACHNK
ncbi:MAG: cytochrome C [Desulfuromonadales bacterium]|nr:MAG: cytochrome C [Desulfuromonadales bacterium]